MKGVQAKSKQRFLRSLQLGMEIFLLAGPTSSKVELPVSMHR